MKKSMGVWSPAQLGLNLDSIIYYLCDLDLHEPQSPQEGKNADNYTVTGLL